MAFVAPMNTSLPLSALSALCLFHTTTVLLLSTRPRRWNDTEGRGENDLNEMLRREEEDCAAGKTQTAQQILASVARFCSRISNSGILVQFKHLLNLVSVFCRG